MIEFKEDAMKRNLLSIEKAKNKFIALRNRVDDLTPVFEKFKVEYQEIVIQNFGDKGKIMERQRWRPYTPAYLKFKQKKYPGRAMLEVSEKLMTAASNFDSKITKTNFVFEVNGEEYFYFVSDREKYGRKFFYTKNQDMPIQAWRLLIQLIEERIDAENV